MDVRCKDAIRFEFHNFHRPFDRGPAALVTPAHDRPNTDGRVGIQPEFDVWIPAWVIANMFDGEKVEHLIDWPVDHLRGFKL